jgi:hypothetical protein
MAFTEHFFCHTVVPEILKTMLILLLCKILLTPAKFTERGSFSHKKVSESLYHTNWLPKATRNFTKKPAKN